MNTIPTTTPDFNLAKNNSPVNPDSQIYGEEPCPFDNRFTELLTGERKEKRFSPELSFVYDPDTDGVSVYEADGYMLSLPQFAALVLKVKSFYEKSDPQIVSRYNTEMRKELERVFNDEKASATLPAPGWIYLIRADNGHYKIGKSLKGTRRAYDFTISLPFRVEVIHQFHTPDHDHEERRLHERFADKRVNGEWFLLSGGDVLEIMALGQQVAK